jgi:hypothetical protein
LRILCALYDAEAPRACCFVWRRRSDFRSQ